MKPSQQNFVVPRGLIAGTASAICVVWLLYALAPGDPLPAAAQTGGYLGLLALTATFPRAKIALVRVVQRFALNPLVRALHAVGINPLGLAILETRGRATGLPRRVPVGNGRTGGSFWIIAEHGRQAGWVRNIERDPRVRVRLRVGLRYRWVAGNATIRPDDDALARQRSIIAWHPLRALNAINVRVLGAELLVVHVRLDGDLRASDARERELAGQRR